VTTSLLAFASSVLAAQVATASPAPVGAPQGPAPVAPTAAAAAPATRVVGSDAAADYVLEGGSVIAVQGEHRERLALDGPVLSLYRQGTSLYVARGARGVTIFEVSEPLAPRRVRDVVVSGSATGFHVVDGQIWVVTVSRSAVPIDDARGEEATAPPGAVAAPAAPRAAEPAGGAPRRAPSDVSIRRVTPGTVELAVGATAGVRVGDRFGIFRSKAMSGEGPESFNGEELVTIVEVVAVRADSALADTGRTAIVEPTDHARPVSADQTASLAFPPRVPHVGEVSVTLRPLVNAGSPLGAGVLADVEAAYWGDAYFADLRIQPLGLGVTSDGVVVSTAALAEGGYDARPLAVGLGVGISWVNGNMDRMLERFGGSSDTASTPGGPTVSERQETHAAFTLSQVMRLGARDGLNLSLRNLLLLHRNAETDQSGFIYGGTAGNLSIPVGARADLFLEGGGGLMGYWFAGVGVATWIVGNGSPGSWKLSVSGGAAGILGSKTVTETIPSSSGGQPVTNTYDQNLDVTGPMVSLGLTRRFSL
jgi:hypothetical protein